MFELYRIHWLWIFSFVFFLVGRRKCQYGFYTTCGEKMLTRTIKRKTVKRSVWKTYSQLWAFHRLYAKYFNPLINNDYDLRLNYHKLVLNYKMFFLSLSLCVRFKDTIHSTLQWYKSFHRTNENEMVRTVL